MRDIHWEVSQFLWGSFLGANIFKWMISSKATCTVQGISTLKCFFITFLGKFGMYVFHFKQNLDFCKIFRPKIYHFITYINERIPLQNAGVSQFNDRFGRGMRNVVISWDCHYFKRFTLRETIFELKNCHYIIVKCR